jgi:hypothetical protein
MRKLKIVETKEADDKRGGGGGIKEGIKEWK